MKTLISLTALAAALSAHAAYAQPPKPDEVETLVVTRARSGQSQRLGHIGGSVTVL